MPTNQSALVDKSVYIDSNSDDMTKYINAVYPLWNRLTKETIVSNKGRHALIRMMPTSASYSSKASGDNKLKQNLLPYPVLPLAETLERFLLTAQPLLTEKEFELQKKITKEFKDKEGDELQELLEKVGKEEKNWLGHRWQKTAYLKYRDPVTVYVSPGMTFPLQKFNNTEEYIDFVAKAIHGLGEFKLVTDEGKIPVAKIGKNELDNGQFGLVYGTCRIPARTCDKMSYNPCSKHFVVMYKNNFYKLELFGADGKVISAPAFAKQITEIMKETKKGIPYGILTTDNRDNWAEAYEHLVKDDTNQKSICTIQTALFIISLDECVSYDPEHPLTQLIISLIHGDGSKLNGGNRWMDKTIQLCFNPNGHVGFTYEHSPAEGQPIGMMMDFLVKKIEGDKNYGSSGSTEVCDPPQMLKFAPVTPCIEQWLHIAKKNIDKLVNDLEMRVIVFKCFGKEYIKQKKLGPDSFVQMALQLAFYKMHKKPAAQYESAHLRIFDGGRTETIRSCSNESLAFCKAMVDTKLPNAKKAILMRAAIAGHQKYARNALAGIGVDRHLLGLRLMAEENGLPIPKFFSSPGYVKSQHFRVSTSQVATPFLAFMGYGAGPEDGYGACYNPRANDIIVAVSAWSFNSETNAIEFGKQLQKAFEEMKEVLDEEPEAPPKAKL